MTRRCKLTVDNNLQPHVTADGNYWAAGACVHNVQQFAKPRENATCRRTYNFEASRNGAKTSVFMLRLRPWPVTSGWKA